MIEERHASTRMHAGQSSSSACTVWVTLRQLRRRLLCHGLSANGGQIVIASCFFVSTTQRKSTSPRPGSASTTPWARGSKQDPPNRQNGGWLEQIEGRDARLWTGTQIGGVSTIVGRRGPRCEDHHWGALGTRACDLRRLAYRHLISLPSCSRSLCATASTAFCPKRNRLELYIIP